MGIVEFDDDLLGKFDQRIKIDAKTYVLGATHTVDFTPKTKLTTLLSFVRSDTHMPVDTMSLRQPNAEWKTLWDERALEDKYSLYAKIEHRFSYTSSIESGVKYDLYDVNYLEKESFSDERGVFTNVDKKGAFSLWRAYAQYRQNATLKLLLTGGLHGMYLDFNQTYAVEPRLGARYRLAEKHTFALAGDTRYTPVFEEESKRQRKLVYDNSRVNQLQVRHYFRTDLRMGYRKNRKRVTNELAIDFQNVTNRKNIFGLSFDVDKGVYTEILLQGFMPMVTYRVNFSL